MKPIQQLKALHLEANRRRFPELPEYARVAPKYTDKDANGLTRCLIDYIRLTGGQAERINNTGRPIDQRKQVVDVLGRARTIGSMKWIPGTGTRGTADISATIRGRSVKIEVKKGRDRQSQAQIEYQRQIEASGGIYFIAMSFDQFFNWYSETFTPATRAKSQMNEI